MLSVFLILFYLELLERFARLKCSTEKTKDVLNQTCKTNVSTEKVFICVQVGVKCGSGKMATSPRKEE